MTSRSDHPKKSERQIERRKSYQAVLGVDEAVLAAHMQQLIELNEGIDALAEAIADRPTNAEATRRRRAIFMVALILIIGTTFLADEHIERCGPGAEVKAALDYVLTTSAGEVDRDELRRVTEKSTPGICTVIFPTHIHDDEAEWPNTRAILGLCMYGLVLAGGWWFALRKPPPIPPKSEVTAEDIKP